MLYNVKCNYFRFGGRHLAFRYRSTSAAVGDDFVESGDPENAGIAVGTACLSVVECEM
jgi:hypothetical protein